MEQLDHHPEKIILKKARFIRFKMDFTPSIKKGIFGIAECPYPLYVEMNRNLIAATFIFKV